MSSTTKLSLSDRAAAKWAEMRPWALGLAIGLVAGPIISAISGFQVRTSTAQAATHAGVVEQQASFCAERARAANTAAGATGPMDWQKRSDLAEKTHKCALPVPVRTGVAPEAPGSRARP